MASHNDGPYYLPITWPFRAAGTVVIAAVVWFCTGWGIRDLGPEERLWNHMNVFWLLLAVAFVLCVLGGIINMAQSRRRQAAIAQE
ncbi:MAG: hypothetical protein KDC33_03555 [Thermoleophilia bacterium]|nr:hypothetical protein [Thermoleophilia bacterium]